MAFPYERGNLVAHDGELRLRLRGVVQLSLTLAFSLHLSAPGIRSLLSLLRSLACARAPSLSHSLSLSHTHTLACSLGVNLVWRVLGVAKDEELRLGMRGEQHLVEGLGFEV